MECVFSMENGSNLSSQISQPMGYMSTWEVNKCTFFSYSVLKSWSQYTQMIRFVECLCRKCCSIYPHHKYRIGTDHPSDSGHLRLSLSFFVLSLQPNYFGGFEEHRCTSKICHNDHNWNRRDFAFVYKFTVTEHADSYQNFNIALWSEKMWIFSPTKKANFLSQSKQQYSISDGFVSCCFSVCVCNLSTSSKWLGHLEHFQS